MAFNDAWTQLRETVQMISVVDGLIQQAGGYLVKEAEALAVVDGNAVKQARIANAYVASRSAQSDFLATAADLMLPPLIRIGEEIGETSQDPAKILLKLREYFDTNTESVLSRNFTFGTVAAGGTNVGDGTVYRCVIDKYGFQIERCHADVISMKCEIDSVLGGAVKGKESFSLKGRRASDDQLELDGSAFGSGEETTARALEIADSLVFNGSFGNADSDSAPASIPGWLKWNGSSFQAAFSGDGTDVQIDRTNFYVESVDGEEGNPGALQLRSAVRIAQTLGQGGLGSFDSRFPYFRAYATNATVGSFNGTLVVRVGNKSDTQVYTGTGVWTLHVFSVASGDAWPENFNDGDPDSFFEVEITVFTSGFLLFDHFVVLPYYLYDGIFLLPFGGPTRFKQGDTFTFTDTHSATPGQIQTWLWRAFGFDLPHLASLETRPD